MFIVSDATATFDRKTADGITCSAEIVNEINLASLSGEFSVVLTEETIHRVTLLYTQNQVGIAAIK